jgi:hypothetical protein
MVSSEAELPMMTTTNIHPIYYPAVQQLSGFRVCCCSILRHRFRRSGAVGSLSPP